MRTSGHSMLDEGLNPSFKWSMLFSGLIHLLVFLLVFVILPGFSSAKRKRPPIYTVNLVSLPAFTKIPTATTTKKKTVTKKKKFRIPQEKTKLIGLKKPDKTKKEKPTVKKKKKTAPKITRKKAPDASQDLELALDRIRKKMKDKKEENEKLAKTISGLSNTTDKTDAPAAISGLSGSGPQTELDGLMGEYLVVMVNIINANWNMPPAELLKKKNDLESIYIIRISPEGDILKSWFERKSGEQFFDRSVEKAFIRIGSLLPLPESFKGKYYEVGLRFTPSGAGQ